MLIMTKEKTERLTPALEGGLHISVMTHSYSGSACLTLRIIQLLALLQSKFDVKLGEPELRYNSLKQQVAETAIIR
jgi:hypothetical protein